MRRFCIAILFAALASRALAVRTFYIDFATGSDANSVAAAQSKTTPWKHCPQMTGSTISGYSHMTADQFIFKGGVTWDHTCFTMTISTGGTAGNSDFYGTDVTWFTGGAFTRPIFDGEGVTLASGTNIVSWTANNVTMDNIEIKRMFIAANTFGIGSIAGFNANASNYLINNCYIHGWTIGPSVTTDDARGGIIFSLSAATNVQVTNCTFSNTENCPTITSGSSTTSNTIGTGAKTFAVTGGLTVAANDRVVIINDANHQMGATVTSFIGGSLIVTVNNVLGSGTLSSWTIKGPGAQNGIAVRQVSTVAGCTFTDISTALAFVGVIHDNVFSNINTPTSTFDVSFHTNVMYIALWDGATTTVTTTGAVYNNVIHDIDAGTQIYCEQCFGGNDGTINVYNNVLWNNNANGGGACVLADPEGGTGAMGTVNVYNNTLVSTGATILASQNHSGTNNIKTMDIRNNQSITSSTAFSLTGVTNLTQSNNVTQTAAAAATQGYTTGNQFAPINTSGATYNTGVTVALFSTDALGVSRPQASIWDIGAYEYVSAAVTKSSQAVGNAKFLGKFQIR